jgi:hypothetical protein
MKSLLIAALAIHIQYHSNPALLDWIPARCCVTNDCCWEISKDELKPLEGDRYEVRSTGQIKERTDFSPDGKYYRCACDEDPETFRWIRHQGANTRCIFVPFQGT